MAMPKSEKRIADLIRTRRSIRRFSDKDIPGYVLQEILEAARWAPSPHNTQPWRFAVVTSGDGKSRLAEEMGKRFVEDMHKDDLPPKMIERLARISIERMNEAPVILVVCLSEEGFRPYPDARQEFERTMAIQSVGAALQNLLLTVHDLGLGACWMGAPLFCQDTVREKLSLDKSWQPQAMVLIGFPAIAPKVPPRVDLADKVVFR